MVTGVQPALQIPVPGRRTERVLKVPPVAISLDVADSIMEIMRQTAEARLNEDLENRLRTAYRDNPQAAQAIDAEARNEDDFVTRNISNKGFRAFVPTYERYAFLSGTSNVQFDGTDFAAKDLPKDLEAIVARTDGINGRFIDVRLKCNFADFNEATNWQLNQVVIQGEDPAWVNATYEKLRTLLEPERL